MRTTRRFFLALLTIVIGIAVPMTLKPSGVVLAVMWSLIAVALLGAVLTYEPVARRLPYRVVRTVNPLELPPETAEADARLADDCERLADEIAAWMVTQSSWAPNERYQMADMPPEWSDRFNGRLFRILEALVERKYITRDDLRRVATENYRIGAAAHRSDYLRQWAHRLRRR